jgi:bifunctional non-homologous end joining protein LigD
MGKLREYQAKREFDKTSEPQGEVADQRTELPRFVVQEHHARRLHWDFRLERDGVLVSWALPKGVPDDPKRNHLAVHVEDHPLDYIDFQGEIPQGQYGGGKVLIWDEGTYETHKWEMDGPKPEVQVTLHGKRLQGRYVLFRTRGNDWMIHRMDPPQDPDREPMPERIEPMLARLADRLPDDDDEYAYEFKWDGVRGIYLYRPGEVRIQARTGADHTRRYPELRKLGEELGAREVILDGEIVALDERGVPRFERLQRRIGLTSDTDIRRAMKEVPAVYMIFDLLYLDGHRLTGLPYLERRTMLKELGLKGPNWQTPDHQVGGGRDMLDAAERNQLEGVMAKRTDSVYEEGRRSSAWLKVKHHLRQELVIGGWQEGEGKRAGLPGALLVGYWDGDDFVYAGKVGTGFTEEMLRKLKKMMDPIERPTPPFTRGRVPTARTHFVEPRLVAEFEFTEWTSAGQMRAPVFKGLRDDKDPRQVTKETPA